MPKASCQEQLQRLKLQHHCPQAGKKGKDKHSIHDYCMWHLPCDPQSKIPNAFPCSYQSSHYFGEYRLTQKSDTEEPDHARATAPPPR